MGAIPVFAPADTAIPAAEIPAPASFARPLGDDRALLQRERKQGVPEWGVIAFGLGVAACVLALLIAAGAALLRVAAAGPPIARAGRESPLPSAAATPPVARLGVR